MAFKDDVMFYLGTMTNNKEEDPIEEAMIDILEGEEVCPECGHNPCSCKTSDKENSDEKQESDDEEEKDKTSKEDEEKKSSVETEDEAEETEDESSSVETKKECNASRSTETGGGDDDDDGYQIHSSVETKKDGEECSVKDQVLMANKMGGKMASDGFTKEEIEILKRLAKSNRAAVNLPDDHTNGRNGSVKTTIKESISRYAFDTPYENKEDTKTAAILKEMIKSKKLSTMFRQMGNHKAANDFLLAEEMYLDKTPCSMNKFKNAVKKYLF